MSNTKQRFMNKKKVVIIIIISFLIVATAAVAITLYMMDINKQQRELVYMNAVVDAVAERNGLYFNNENRNFKITLYTELNEFKSNFVNNNPVIHEIIREQYRDNVISHFDLLLISMQNWFYNNYVETISSIHLKSDDNLAELELFVDENLSIVDDFHHRFLAFVNKIDIENEQENRVALEISRLYFEVVNSKNQFERNEFIEERIENAETYSIELSVLKTLIANEILKDVNQIQELENKINIVFDELILIIENDDKNHIIIEYEKLIENILNWFLEFYQQVINEITERELANEDDKETIGKQIEDLENVKLFMTEDKVVGVVEMDRFNETIDEFIEEYNVKLEEIAERERLEEERLAREAAERARRQRGSSGGGGSSGGQWVPRFGERTPNQVLAGNHGDGLTRCGACGHVANLAGFAIEGRNVWHVCGTNQWGAVAGG
jgi:hypothetical protein